MSNLTTYPILSLGTSESLKKANIVVVKRQSWNITKANLPTFLSDYSDEDIKIGKLISTGETNIYELSGGGTEFDLIFFVINNFELDEDDLNPSGFTSIGVIQIPKIGIGNPNTTEKLEFIFLESVSTNEVTINDNLSIEVNLEPYKLQGVNSLVNESYSKEFYNSILKPKLNYQGSGKVSFIGGGILFENNFYRKSLIQLEFTNTSPIKSYQQISHKENEYLRFNFTDGSTILRNVSLQPTGELLLETNLYNIYIAPTSNISYILNPDYFVYTNLISRVSYLVKTNAIQTGEYTSISEFSTDEIQKSNSKLVWGTDVENDEVTTIYSDPTNTNWCLQTRFTKFFQSLKYLNLAKKSYTVETHNSKFFVVNEYEKTSSNVFRKLVIDYKGNFIELSTPDYNLDIDGNLIIKTLDGHIGYKHSLDNPVNINSTYELYLLYPSGTEILWFSQVFDLSNILFCRDRIQQL
jgi:hypothetical protein